VSQLARLRVLGRLTQGSPQGLPASSWKTISRVGDECREVGTFD
jgi:hypothetical protein